jgi:alpha-mannosidase
VDLRTGRESVPPGARAAELQLFLDTPNQWEAWDIDAHYRRHGEVIDAVDSIEVTADDGCRVAVRVERSFGCSRLSQEFELRAGSASLEISTRVDWHEQQKLLKLAFPLDVRADRAASEVQFGHVYRPTHENTSWDAARFETSAQRWVQVGEPGFGVALANDSSYGHDITTIPRAGGGVATLVRQSLLRAPLFPDPEADQGEHLMRSSLTVAAGIPEAVREGYRLNLPARPGNASVDPIVTVDNPAVVVETVKLAEDRSGDLVLRLYESLGTRGTAAVVIDASVIDASVQSITETDLLERELAQPSALLAVDGSRAELEVRPFQIVTLRIRLA